MEAALITISGLFALELIGVIFSYGKLWQNTKDQKEYFSRELTDIKQRLVNIESNTCCEGDDNEQELSPQG